MDGQQQQLQWGGASSPPLLHHLGVSASSTTSSTFSFGSSSSTSSYASSSSSSAAAWPPTQESLVVVKDLVGQVVRKRLFPFAPQATVREEEEGEVVEEEGRGLKAGKGGGGDYYRHGLPGSTDSMDSLVRDDEDKDNEALWGLLGVEDGEEEREEEKEFSSDPIVHALRERRRELLAQLSTSSS